MFILYSNIVKDQRDCEQNVKGFHETNSPDQFKYFSHDHSPEHFKYFSPEHFKYFGGTIRKTVHTHLSLSHPYIDM